MGEAPETIGLIPDGLECFRLASRECGDTPDDCILYTRTDTIQAPKVKKPAVKPLSWTHGPRGAWTETGPITYDIREQKSGFKVTRTENGRDLILGRSANLVLAQGRAQKDYESRILSCLEGVGE